MTSARESVASDAGSRRDPGVRVDGAPVGSLLLQVIRAHARVATELLDAAGVVPPHEIVLLHIDAHGPVPQAELVRYLGRDRSTVTATLQAMERAGLVSRTASASDRRAMVVRLTDRGRAAVPRVRAAWRELERRTTRTLDAAQRESLMTGLAAVRDALDESAQQR